VNWPDRKDNMCYNNVSHTKLAEYKESQNWVTVFEEYIIFLGGGNQFKNGALHYIDFIDQSPTLKNN
jgi:hypothetical protein